ncbi:MAG: SDR family NAD(P)-dependent oxidoreductase, partial [Candidatus Hydrogenedentota bacterium]
MSTSLFEDQVIIVTGGGRGIGAAACRIFSEMGGKVVVSDRDEEPTTS